MGTLSRMSSLRLAERKLRERLIQLSRRQKQLIMLVHPTLTIEFSTRWMIQAGVLAIIGGLIGALYPAWRAARVDPVKALQYE